MKKILLLLCFGIISSIAGPHDEKVIYIEESAVFKPLDKLIYAISMVESTNNPLAYNPAEKATGLLQIRPIRLKDYNNKTGSSYKLYDMYNPEISKKIFYYYANVIGYNNPEKIIRCWNGGEGGMLKKSTKIYYQKVLLYL